MAPRVQNPAVWRYINIGIGFIMLLVAVWMFQEAKIFEKIAKNENYFIFIMKLHQKLLQIARLPLWVLNHNFKSFPIKEPVRPNITFGISFKLSNH